MQPMPDVDGDLRAEVLSLCQALIRVDTTNPPGRETAAAVLLRDHLEAAGVDCELVARDPDRANLVARIPGSGDGPSLAFVGHLDVVPADPRAWTHPPFDAVVDGRLPLRPGRRGHEERAGGPGGRDGQAGPLGLPSSW
jgi:acetylornithine deacetylase/succinyl-diaminopimelate desuccinylase-like protein